MDEYIGGVYVMVGSVVFFFQAEDGIRDWSVTGVQTCALPIARALALGGRRHIGDGRREHQWVALPVRRGPTGLDVHLRVHEEHLATPVEGIERVVGLRQGGKPVPRRGAELIVVQRPQDRKSV